MQNEKSKRIQQLRHDAVDEDRSPKDRIKSAERLLSEFGPTGRNLPFINEVIRKFLKDPSYDTQLRAQKLKDKLLKAKDLMEVADAELSDAPETATTEDAMPSIVAGVSASEVPKALSITFEGIRQAIDTIGISLWYLFSEGRCDFTIEQRKAMLANVLDGAPVSVSNVQSLLTELRKKNQLGWNLAASFPALVKIAEEFLKAQGVSTELEKKEPDGFQRGLIDPDVAIARVSAAGYKTLPRGASDPNLLQAALGDVPLDDKSVGQLWLAFGYWFKEVLGGGTAKKGSDIMPAPARWILACICGYANPLHIHIPDPSIFTFQDNCAFRS